MIAQGWTLYMVLAAICMAGMLVSLAGDYRDRPGLRALGKLIAATAYIAAATSLGALDSDYGRILLAGMACCWLGDLLLASHRNRGLFTAAIAAFLVGHLFYSAAFVVRGTDTAAILIATTIMLVFMTLVLRWLAPHLDARMRWPVRAYIGAICVMMIMAAGTFGAHSGWALLLGAGLFVLSDLAVARHRFIQHAFVNRALGLPLYFTAQLLLAASVAPGAGA